MASKGASALSGAGVGAAAGSAIMPGVGTLVGAGVGAVGGWLLGDDAEKAPTYAPSRHNFQYGLGDSGTYASTEASKYNYEQNRLALLGNQAYNRDAPQMNLPDRRDFVGSQGQSYLQGADAEGRQQQLAALGGLQSQTNALNTYANRAQGPSAAQAQLQQGIDAAARQQYGFARSQQGGGGAALRQAAFNASGITGNAANSAAMLRAQEDAAWRQQQLSALSAAQQGAGMSAGYAGQLRGQDQGFAQVQSGQANYDANALNAYNQQQQQLQFGVGQNNQNAALAQGRANDAMMMGTLGMGQAYYGMKNQLAAGQQSAGQAYEAAALQGAGLGSSNFNAATQQSNNELAMGLGAAAGGFAAYNQMNPPAAGGGDKSQVTSDIRAKENIRPVRAGSYFQQVGDRNRERVQGEVDRVQYLRALGGDPSLTSTAEFGPTPVRDPLRERIRAIAEANGGQLPSTWGTGDEPAAPQSSFVPVTSTSAGRVARASRLIDAERGYASFGDSRDKIPDLRPAQGSLFQYRDPERHGEGERMGGMAQQLEHIPGAVSTQPDGTKAVNTPQVTMALAPAVGEQQRRIDDLEAQVVALGGRPGMAASLRSQPVYAQPQGFGGL